MNRGRFGLPALVRRWPARHLALVAGGLALCLGAASCSSSSGAATSTSVQSTGSSDGVNPGTQFTPLAASVLSNPMPVKGTDGKTHLAYELLLTNTTPVTIEISQIQVLDGSTHQVLLSLSGSTLSTNMNLIGALPGDESTADPEQPAPPIPGSTMAIVWLDVKLSGQAPARLEHRVVGSMQPPPGGQANPFDIVVANIPTRSGSPVVLGPPVGKGTWYISEGCCADDTHHRRGIAPINGELLVPQRFAIDFFLLNGQHQAWVGDPTQLTSYLSYDQPVIAAASGTVVDTLDGLPNQQPPHTPPLPPIEDTVGNHVTIQVRPGIFLLYGHLKPGSVRVHKGQRVSGGQVLGLIGNSGMSSTPHLHFQVITTPTFFPTDSLPFVFDHFDLQGQITQRIWDENIGLQPTGALPFVAASPPSMRQNEMPLDRNVIRFSS